MCGIAGRVTTGAEPPERELVERMSAELVHRGPDSCGFHFAESIGLASRRLAIIDVPGGDQPIANEDGSVVVVMNGEIYNFKELREQLVERGHRFATGADTEVLVHLYEDRGRDLVRELRGMFAFALWDGRRRRLLLGRDRVGKKPLLYWRGPDGGLTFASELAALLEDGRIKRRADPRAIDAYLTLLYVPHPLSAVQGVSKLPPASTLVWEDGRIDVTRYWRLDYSRKDSGSPDEVAERVREHLEDAVRVRLLSERPLGVFLSGGVDSTAIVSAMAEVASGPIRTFSIGFDSDRFDETRFARRVANLFGTEHTERRVRPDALAILPKLVTHYGDPFGDSSAIPSYYVAQVARESVVVALNGDGGDESFGGYNRYVANAFAERLETVPRGLRVAAAALAKRLPEPRTVDSNAARVRRLAMSLALRPSARYAYRMTYIAPSLRRALYTAEFAESFNGFCGEDVIDRVWRDSAAQHAVDRMLDVDVQTYLPDDLLVKMDIATMANSLEARSPLLDHRLMEMAARLPASQKVRGGSTKIALKAALRGRVPGDLLDRPKWGFSVPLAEWFRGPLQEPARAILLDPRTRSRGVVRPQVVERLLADHAVGRADRSSELWLLVVLELWYRRFIDGLRESSLL
jgi:asparagine synthase (glutamine-hydrolysing)